MAVAIVVSSGEKSNAFFSEILSAMAFCKIVTVKNAGEARREFIQNEFDLCIINTPLTDENGINLAIRLTSNYNTPVILIVKNEIFDEISERVEEFGVITLQKPINRSLLWSALKMAQASNRRVEIINRENKKLLQKIEDIKIVDRAKCLLISYLNMSESEAHKYIERQAMDMRITKRVVAEGIIKTYEN